MTLLSDVINDSNYTQVLDHGFVGLVEHMGYDSAIVQAARTSYGKGTKTANSDRALIRYLTRRHHTSVFEMVEFKFHVKMPIFVMRQHIRHRTASVNEYSGRYSVMTDEFYYPPPQRLQSQSIVNKQGSGEVLDLLEAEMVQNTIQRSSQEAYKDYLSLINDSQGRDYQIENRKGLSRELARIILPVNNYTEFYWKIDLHNLLRYLMLRSDSHAQQEIQDYANAFAHYVEKICPIAFKAFEDYIVHGHSLSRMTNDLLQEIIKTSNQHNQSFNQAWQTICQTFENRDSLCEFYDLSKRELDEFQKHWNLNWNLVSS
jgi:thymidylate synthase (FAD)